MSILEVINLSAGYNGVLVIKEISISIDSGECVAIFGANGFGKTTVLSCLAGLLKPVSGEILLKGKNISDLPPNKIVEYGLALVPEGRRIFQEHTVRENLELGDYIFLKRKKTVSFFKSKAKQIVQERSFAKKMEDVLKIFPQIGKKLEYLAGTLSGGEQQMLAIARALVRDPIVLVLDEPSLGLGPKIIDQMTDVLMQLKKKGISILIADQAVWAALRICDRALVLRPGGVPKPETPSELLSNQDFVSAYLGTGRIPKKN